MNPSYMWRDAKILGRVCEIFDKAQGQPFHAHLQEEDHSKYTVHVVQDVLQGRSIFQVYILKSLKKKWMKIESNLVEFLCLPAQDCWWGSWLSQPFQSICFQSAWKSWCAGCPTLAKMESLDHRQYTEIWGNSPRDSSLKGSRASLALESWPLIFRPPSWKEVFI